MSEINRRTKNYDVVIHPFKDSQVKGMLERFIFEKDVYGFILDFFGIDNAEENILLFQCLNFGLNKQRKWIVEKYSTCVTALEYVKMFSRLIEQTEIDIYEERIDTIKDVDIPEELREHIVNTFWKGGYPFGLRIRRLPGEYVIYWDKIQLNNMSLEDFGFNYSKELIEHGMEATKERVRRLLR